MKWAAVQKEASEFRSDRDERLTQKQTEQALQAQLKLQEQLASVEGLRTAGLATLDQIGVPDILKAIKDEVWNEGTITLFHYIPEFGVRDTRRVGLRLESDNIPILDYKLNYGNPSAQIQNVRTSLETAVSFNEDNTPGGTIFVEETSYLIIPSLYPEYIRRIIREMGLTEGLKFLTYQSHPCISKDHWMFSRENTKYPECARGIIADWFDTTITEETNYQRLPDLARSKSELMLQSFPSSLKEKGDLSAIELREWSYKVKGLNPVHRLADRFFRQHLNLALPL